MPPRARSRRRPLAPVPARDTQRFAELVELAAERFRIAVRRRAQRKRSVAQLDPDPLVRGVEGDADAQEEQEAAGVDDRRRRIARNLQARRVERRQAIEAEGEPVFAVVAVELPLAGDQPPTYRYHSRRRAR